MAVLVHEIFADLLEDYHSGHFGTYTEPLEVKNDPGGLARILVSCILSSNWRYDLAIKAAHNIVMKYSLHEPSSPIPASETLEDYLRTVIRHRYPSVKAQQLHNSLHTLRRQASIFCVCNNLDTQRELRSRVVSMFPGLGLKQSSMFLRDAGIAMKLAIIDVHVIWFMKNIESETVGTLTTREYLRVEDHLREVAQRLSVPMSVLDSIIWTLVRLVKKAKREPVWETQYVLPLEAWTPPSASHS